MPYRRNGNWYSDLRPRVGGNPTGKRIRKLLPNCKFKWEAERAERKLASELLYGVEGETPTFEDFVRNSYLPWAREHKRSYAHDEYRAEVLIKAFKGRKMDEFSVIQFENFKRDRKLTITRHHRLRTPATINAEITIARSIFRRAVIEGVITRNPLKDVKNLDGQPSRIRRLHPDEEERIWAELDSPGYLRPVCTIALNTGMRAGEIARIEVEDIDFARDVLYVREPKWTGDKRQSQGIPLNATARAVLWSLCLGKKGRLFYNLNGPLNTPNISTTFRNACQRAGVKGFRFHDLRHEFGSRLGDLNRSPYEIAELMGHADIKMSMIYVHAQEGSLKRAVAEIDSRTFGHSAGIKRGDKPQRTASKLLTRKRM